MRDARKKLDGLLKEWQSRARSAYVKDPHGEAITFIEELFDEYIDMLDDSVYGDGFESGYRHALHLSKELYIQHSGKYSCECTVPFAEEEKRGVWYCGKCGQELVGADETVPQPGARETHLATAPIHQDNFGFEIEDVEVRTPIDVERVAFGDIELTCDRCGQEFSEATGGQFTINDGVSLELPNLCEECAELVRAFIECDESNGGRQ